MAIIFHRFLVRSNHHGITTAPRATARIVHRRLLGGEFGRVQISRLFYQKRQSCPCEDVDCLSGDPAADAFHRRDASVACQREDIRGLALLWSDRLFCYRSADVQSLYLSGSQGIPRHHDVVAGSLRSPFLFLFLTGPVLDRDVRHSVDHRRNHLHGTRGACGT